MATFVLKAVWEKKWKKTDRGLLSVWWWWCLSSSTCSIVSGRTCPSVSGRNTYSRPEIADRTPNTRDGSGFQNIACMTTASNTFSEQLIALWLNNNWNIRYVWSPHAHPYTAIFKLFRPFDHRMTPWKFRDDICSGSAAISRWQRDKQTDTQTDTTENNTTLAAQVIKTSTVCFTR